MKEWARAAYAAREQCQNKPAFDALIEYRTHIAYGCTEGCAESVRQNKECLQ